MVQAKNKGGGTRRLISRAANRVLASAIFSRSILRQAVVVFLYHEVSDHPSEFNRLFGLNVSPKVFSKQMDLIRDYFHILNPPELLRGKHPRPAALITFDDGNASYFRNALPILKEKKIPSVIFLNMGPIEGEICWSGLVTYLQYREGPFYEKRNPGPKGNDFCWFTEEEVNRYLDTVDKEALLRQARAFRGVIAEKEDLQTNEPLVTFGNHLYNHHNALLLGAGARLKEMYWRNQTMLEDLPRGSRLLSYPFSCWDRQTKDFLMAEGAQAVFMGGGLPNLRRNGNLFYRVELGDKVATEEGMISEVIKNIPGAAWRGWRG